MSNIELVDHKLNHLTYMSQNQSEGFAVFSEVYYPKGWQAYIDDEAVDHLQVNYTLRGIQIPAGKHKVKFIFEPSVIKTGSRISLAGHIIFILIIGFGCFNYLKSSKSLNE
jgi:uncharacterized membrane protein YfhO